MSAASNTPRSTNGSASRATSAPSASPHYAQEQLGDVVFVELPRGRPQGRARASEAAVVESVKAASEVYAPGRRRGGRGQRRARRRARRRSTPMPMGEGWFFKLQARRPERARRADGRGRLRGLRRGACTDALSAAHRRRPRAPCWPRSASPSVDELFRDVPAVGAARRGLSICRRTRASSRSSARFGRMAAQERRRRRGAVLPRRRRLSPSRAGGGRSSDPARRIPHLLHALPAGDRAGHAAIPVRIPDPGGAAHRHGGGQRLDVRRLDRHAPRPC